MPQDLDSTYCSTQPHSGEQQPADDDPLTGQGWWIRIVPTNPLLLCNTLLVNWACPSSLRRAASCSLALFAEFSPGLVGRVRSPLEGFCHLFLVENDGGIQQLSFSWFWFDNSWLLFFRFVFLVCFGDVRNRKNVDLGMVFSTFRNYFKPGTPVLPRPVLFQQLPVVSITRCCLWQPKSETSPSHLWSMAHSQSDFNHQRFPHYVQFLEVTITNNQLTLIKPKPHQKNRDFSYQKHSNIITFQKKFPPKKIYPKYP